MPRAISASLLLLVCFVTLVWSQETPPAPTELSENSVQALLIRKVAPVYPPLARQARIQGTVILKIVIQQGRRRPRYAVVQRASDAGAGGD
jgi:hypothetical protein